MKASTVESAVIGNSSGFGRWISDELKTTVRVVAREGQRDRYEFGEFVPAVKGVRVTVLEFERSPGRIIDGVIDASALDAPVVYARKWAGFVEVMAGVVRPVGSGLSEYVLG